MPRDLAIVTMTYNERHKLPRWIEHYRGQAADTRDLYILDHGSNDGSTDDLPDLNVVRIPRGEHFTQDWRTSFVSGYCASLLSTYRYVLYTDTDELVVADPGRFRTLLDYVVRSPPGAHCTIGFDVVHDIEHEPGLQPGPVSGQRSKLQFVASMCKPLLISRPTTWTPGFHTSSNRPSFGDLFLFHLRYADLNEGRERLGVTRALLRPDRTNSPVDHQKIPDATFEEWMRHWLSFPVAEEEDIFDSPVIRDMLGTFGFALSARGTYDFDYTLRSPQLFLFPAAWRGIV
jgi:hypothetical protein